MELGARRPRDERVDRGGGAMRIGIDARKIADFGIGTYIRGLLDGLTELGTRDTYIAFAPASARIPAGVEHIEVSAPHYSLRELIVLGRAADRARLDVFHAPHYVVPFTHTPLVVTIHDLIHLHQPLRNPLAPLYARSMIRRAVRKARVILTVSEAVKRELEREVAATQVIVTPNGTEVVAPRDADVDAPRYLYVGNDKPHKNADALIDAFARVRRERGDATLVLAGGEFSRYRALPGVATRGFVSNEELDALYRTSIALVLPSIEEGFGLPALEAMARGTPVITSNAAALVEVTGDAALHEEARDVRALANAMLRVARDAELRVTMSARGVERARSFTWRRCAERTREAYERAL
jgi:glycosyltransferase involved in cell wall biosynthesis